MFNFLITIVVILAIIGSIAAWMNTKIILEELALIKKELGIKEEKKDDFFSDEFNNDK